MNRSRTRMLAVGSGLGMMLLGLAVSLAQGAGAPDKQAEQQVLMKMHQVNQMEIQMGDMAIEKGQSRAVKSFGRTLKRDHTANDRKVMSVARQEGIDMTTNAAMDDQGRRMHDELQSATGKDFDRAFVKAMAEGHQSVAETLKQDRDSLGRGRVRSLVASTIPTVQKHERTAKSLQSKV